MTNNGEDSDQDVEDFSDSDVDEVPDDIDDEGPEKVEDVHGLLFNNPSRGIILRNKLEGDMLNVDPDAGYASEFLVYADIVRAHRLAVNSQFEELFVGQQFEYKANCVFAIKLYNMKLSIDYKVVKSTSTLYVGECWRGGDGCGWRVRAAFIQTTQQWQIRKLEGCHTCTVAQYIRKIRAKNTPFRYKLARLEIDMAGSNPSLRQWWGSMEPCQWAQYFDKRYRYGQMTTNLVDAINSVLRCTRHLPISTDFLATFYRLETLIPKMGLKQAKQLEAGHVYVEKIRDAMKENTQRRCECGMFQTLRYPCTHVVVACATYSLNVEQYIDNVYTLECTLRIWSNEFPILRDVSTWEVQPPTFEMLPDRSLRRRVKGRPAIMKIQNDMDIREQVDPKHCTICRTVSHNRSKCHHENVYTGRSSRSERN
ncbi:hypothetical protein GOBAR_AA19952 [Gossypium barbadense]|uniref:SWIM-type domain-containing protein n=1 Tax=Gossypium barbadense TaxID=3634 RepID=A0A2P5XBJ7_GOSBA|nr:hypothetical protein GOBAR_AA19952 [Gossypium barbadense]